MPSIILTPHVVLMSEHWCFKTRLFNGHKFLDISEVHLELWFALHQKASDQSPAATCPWSWWMDTQPPPPLRHSGTPVL